MEEWQKIKKLILLIIPPSFFFFLFLVVMIGTSAGGNATIMIGNFFAPPFEQETKYQITSPFGIRQDPFESEKETFHTGIDLSAIEGSDIVSSADGTVLEIGFSENGLGNFVYIEHSFDGLIFYSAYGHMLDNSIVVQEGQAVKAGEKLGIIGSTGASTGTHLHFSIMEKKLMFDQEHLIDPKIIFEN